jgi:hypothetical protein
MRHDIVLTLQLNKLSATRWSCEWTSGPDPYSPRGLGESRQAEKAYNQELKIIRATGGIFHIAATFF